MRWLGLDVHKHYAYVVDLCSDGTRNDSRFPLPGGLPGFCKELTDQCQIALEASTNSFRVAEVLSSHAGRVVVCDPTQTRGVMHPGVTTDKLAAEALARCVQSGFLRPVWAPPPLTRALRCMVAHHARLTRTALRAMNRVRSLLHQEMIEEPAQLFGRAGRQFLQGLFLEEPGHRFYLCSLLREIDQSEDELLDLEKLFADWSRGSKEASLLMSIPGVGPVLAAAILAPIGDIRRFPSPRQLTAYAGLAPRVHNSGKTRRTGRISRAGCGRLRWALTMVAWTVARTPGILDEYRAGLAARRPKGVVNAAVARKLLTIIWSMLTHERRFREEDAGLTLRKAARLQRIGPPSPRALEVPAKPRRSKR